MNRQESILELILELILWFVAIGGAWLLFTNAPALACALNWTCS